MPALRLYTWLLCVGMLTASRQAVCSAVDLEFQQEPNRIHASNFRYTETR